jgi:endonuclease/exonuclease/phosphatase family metal-dependent hydrolase
MRRRTFIQKAGLAAAMPFLFRQRLTAAETNSSPPTAAHKFLSCNIRVDVPDDAKEKNSWADRKALCIEVIRKQQADVICLQECQETHWKDLRASLPHLEGFGLANPDAVFHPANGILFSRERYEVISAGGFWLSETPHIAGSKSWDSARSRFANWVDLQERRSGKKFRAWSAHLDHLGKVARDNQARVITEAATALPNDLAQIFAADCNAPLNSPPIQRLKTAGWRDTYEEVHGPNDPGFTFHAFRGPTFPDRRPGQKINGKIDWIFSRGPVKTMAAEIIRDGKEGHYPSDHYFVSATVTI